MAKFETEPDTELLRRFCNDGAGGAFEVLVRRYADMVCGVARRVTGRRELAEEVAQNVFASLAHKARSLVGRGGRLAGWLHRATVFESKHLLRTELRHHRRMRVAGEQQQIADTKPTGDDTALRSEIDDGIELVAAGRPGPAGLALLQRHDLPGDRRAFRQVGGRGAQARAAGVGEIGQPAAGCGRGRIGGRDRGRPGDGHGGGRSGEGPLRGGQRRLWPARAARRRWRW